MKSGARFAVPVLALMSVLAVAADGELDRELRRENQGLRSAPKKPAAPVLWVKGLGERMLPFPPRYFVHTSRAPSADFPCTRLFASVAEQKRPFHPANSLLERQVGEALLCPVDFLDSLVRERSGLQHLPEPEIIDGVEIFMVGRMRPIPTGEEYVSVYARFGSEGLYVIDPNPLLVKTMVEVAAGGPHRRRK